MVDFVVDFVMHSIIVSACSPAVSLSSLHLNRWFPIDIVATVQWDMLVAFAFQIGKDSDSLVYIRLCRLLKVARIARASRLIQRLTAR